MLRANLIAAIAIAGFPVVLVGFAYACRTSYRKGFEAALQMDNEILAEASKKLNDGIGGNHEN